MSDQPKFEDATINKLMPSYGFSDPEIRSMFENAPLLKVFPLNFFASTSFINAFLEKKWPGIFGAPFKIKLGAPLDGQIGPAVGGLHSVIDPNQNKGQGR